ncbi:AlpA family transcriptional regulator [Solimonas sp. SE-A11]|uniref:helix-turn-helix transcriptional regulator n=1 Tax=Solimonas sp. SE-A11 TaxID=3054954 RepID=UPI00259D22DC|nr:AlpA family phage regulatory protein [Solimonas sp. SE-A11]MDM4770848.1 AlpA family phage regulatory protein [Solimonas sp. SE-A11]
MSIALLKAPALCGRLGCSRAHAYALVKDRLLMRPIHLTQRAVAWPSNEVDEYIAAKVRGASADELRDLVQRLEQARTAPREVAA